MAFVAACQCSEPFCVTLLLVKTSVQGPYLLRTKKQPAQTSKINLMPARDPMHYQCREPDGQSAQKQQQRPRICKGIGPLLGQKAQKQIRCPTLSTPASALKIGLSSNNRGGRHIEVPTTRQKGSKVLAHAAHEEDVAD